MAVDRRLRHVVLAALTIHIVGCGAVVAGAPGAMLSGLGAAAMSSGWRPNPDSRPGTLRVQTSCAGAACGRRGSLDVSVAPCGSPTTLLEVGVRNVTLSEEIRTATDFPPLGPGTYCVRASLLTSSSRFTSSREIRALIMPTNLAIVDATIDTSSDR